MKSIFYFFIPCLLSLPLFNLNAQIAITSTNMPVVNDTARYSNASLSSVGDYTATGANHNWDFSTLDSTGQQLRRFQPSAATPYAFYFFPPKYGEKTQDSIPIPPQTGFSIKNIYSFYKKAGTVSFNSEGLGLTMNSIPVGATFSDEDELYVFPLNYGDRDSTTFKLSTPSNTMIPFQYKKQGYRITEADGWGTITTPFGTEACLRVVTTQYSIDTITINALPAPFNKLGFPNYMRSYQWLTLTEKIPYLEVSGNIINGNFTATQAKYRDKLRVFAGLKEQESEVISATVFPNPAKDQFTLLVSQSSQSINYNIVDLQGKTVLSGKLENNRFSINAHLINLGGISAGSYFLNLNTLSSKQTIKISVQ